jgi:hypothetical protein
MARASLSLLLVGAFVVAGCLDPSTKTLGPDGDLPSMGASEPSPRLPIPDFDFRGVIDPDHGGVTGGHGVTALHTGSYGLELVSYMPLTRPADGTMIQDAAYTGIDVWGTYACATQFPGPGGFILIDIKDPAKPKVVSSMPSGMANQMCRITDDGQYLLLGAYIGGNNQPAPTGGADPAGVGVEVYDIKDPADPRFLYHDTQGAEDQSTHGLYTAKIGDTNYAFYSYSGQIFAIGRDGLHLVSTLEKSFHDAWAGKHPVTGEWISIQGNGCNLVVYNIDDPAHPIELGEWSSDDEEAEFPETCADHWRRPITHTVGGRAYVVVVGAEGDGSSLHYNILDFTNPADMFQVSQWQIPGAPESPEPNFYTFGGTEYETWNGYVAAGLMHGGVWVFDIGSPERAQEPVTMGYYQAPKVPQLEGGTTNKPFPFVPLHWTAAFDERGYVISPDTSTGLYILKFQGTMSE